MIRHALAVALLGIGIGFAGHAPVHAAPPLSGVAPSIRIADDTVVKVGCLDEVPVVSGVVIFFQLLGDEEINRHCPGLFDRDDDDRHTYDDRKYPSYKDGGYAQPKDLKAPLR